MPCASARSPARADHRPVGERVGEREADLDDVRSTLDGGLGELRRTRARHQVDDERLAHASGASRVKSVASESSPPCRRNLRRTPSRVEAEPFEHTLRGGVLERARARRRGGCRWRRRARRMRRPRASRRPAPAPRRRASSRPRPHRASDRGGAAHSRRGSRCVAVSSITYGESRPRSFIIGSCSRSSARNVSASTGGSPASPPTSGSRNAGAIGSTSSSCGARTSNSSTRTSSGNR